METLTPMMQQYLKIKKKYPDYLLMFRLGDFYEFFFDDAKTASKILNITLTSRPVAKGKRIPMAGVPHHSAKAYIKKLLLEGYKIALCEQTSEPGKAKIVDREVVRIITPGTYIEEELEEEQDNLYIFTFTSEKEKYGFAFSDPATGEFFAQEGNFDEVFDILKKLPIKEVVVENENSLSPFKKVIELKKISVSLYSPDDIFDSSQYLKEFFKIKSLKSFGIDNKPLAIISSAYLLSYLNYTQKQAPQITEIKPFIKEKYLYLDPATIRNLEIFENYYGKTTNTLFSLLNQCKTAMGRRMLKKFLLQPLKEKNKIEERLNIVELFYKDQNLLEKTREILRDIYDLERLSSKISNNLHSPSDLVNLKLSLNSAFVLKELLEKTNSDLFKPIITKFKESLIQLAQLINKTLVDDPVEAGEGNLIKPGVNPKIDELKELTSSNQKWLLEFEKKERERTKIPTLKVGYNKVFGYYIEITKPYAKKVPQEYIRKQTLVGSERYITLELKEKEEKILSAQEEILNEEKKELEKLRNAIKNLIKELKDLSQALGFIDVLSNFAYVSRLYDYKKPEFIENGSLEIIEGRHPVVEQALKDQEFVKNDTYLNKKDQQILIITGPNMAGKSVYIRQVAIICLMAHIGCFVPAKKAKLPVLDRIAVRSGAGDIIAEGLSTFMVEMVETAGILHSITDKSLVVLDEIGRGTSTYDGISIAWAVAEYLAKTKGKKAFALFATHYHELQSLADFNPNVKNFQMQVKQENGDLIFTYKLTKGSAPHSFGIEVAKKAGLPKEVIEKANEILKILEGKSEKVRPRKIVLEQHNLFSHISKAEDHPAIKLLEKTDPNKLTPLQALELIYKLKEML